MGRRQSPLNPLDEPPPNYVLTLKPRRTTPLNHPLSAAEDLIYRFYTFYWVGSCKPMARVRGEFTITPDSHRLSFPNYKENIFPGKTPGSSFIYGPGISAAILVNLVLFIFAKLISHAIRTRNIFPSGFLKLRYLKLNCIKVKCAVPLNT